MQYVLLCLHLQICLLCGFCFLLKWVKAQSYLVAGVVQVLCLCRALLLEQWQHLHCFLRLWLPSARDLWDKRLALEPPALVRLPDNR